MADDPVTLTLVDSWTLAPGLKQCVFSMVGPADYDDDPGAACDLSTWFEKIHFVFPPCCTDAQADAKVDAKYYNDDYTDADGGYITFSWSGTGVGAAVSAFANVTDATDLSTYTWRLDVIGTQKAAS